MIEFLLARARSRGPVPLPGGKPRALLARLLLDAGRVVAAESLVDALWGETPPPSAPKVLQAHVSALRKALGGGRDRDARRPATRCAARPPTSRRFEELAERPQRRTPQRRATAAARGARALARRAARRVPARAVRAPAAARLAELRLDALGRRIDAELELGLHEQLVARARARSSTRSRCASSCGAQLMLALYRSGRQAEALERLPRRRGGCSSTGSGSSRARALQELERAILRQDPSLGAVARQRAAAGRSSASARASLALRRAARPRACCSSSSSPTRPALAGGRARASSRRRCRPARAHGLLHLDRAGRGPGQARRPSRRPSCSSSASRRGLLAGAPCDVALAASPAPFEPSGPMLVAVRRRARGVGRRSSSRAWLARAHGLPLRLLGVEATESGATRAACSRAASLALQRFAGIAAEPVIVSARRARAGGLGDRRLAAARRLDDADSSARAIPVLLVQGGLRPSGLAPEPHADAVQLDGGTGLQLDLNQQTPPIPSLGTRGKFAPWPSSRVEGSPDHTVPDRGRSATGEDRRGAARRQVLGRARRALWSARPERRRQDDHDQDPHDAAPPVDGLGRVLGFDVAAGRRGRCRGRIGYVFGGDQASTTGCPAYDNLRYFADLYRVRPVAAAARIDELLELVGPEGSRAGASRDATRAG